MKSIEGDHVLEVVGRPPRRGRGLKSEIALGEGDLELSPPSQGAWIEIFQLVGIDRGRKVAPLAGGVD